MVDEKKPPDHPTTQIPQSEILSSLLRNLETIVKDGFARTEARFDTVDERIGRVEMNHDGTTEMVINLQQRMTLIDERQNKIEGRQTSNSERAKGASQVDSKHDAAIGTIVSEQAELKTKTDEALSKLAENTAKTEEALASTKAVQASLKDPRSGAVIVYEDLKKSPTFQRVMYAFAVFLLAALGYGAMALNNLASKVHQ